MTYVTPQVKTFRSSRCLAKRFRRSFRYLRGICISPAESQVTPAKGQCYGLGINRLLYLRQRYRAVWQLRGPAPTMRNYFGHNVLPLLWQSSRLQRTVRIFSPGCLAHGVHLPSAMVRIDVTQWERIPQVAATTDTAGPWHHKPGLDTSGTLARRAAVDPDGPWTYTAMFVFRDGARRVPQL